LLPKAAGFVNCDTIMPPFASITRCDGTLPMSVVFDEGECFLLGQRQNE